MEPSIPDDNHAYKRKEYWDTRFESEETYDWIAQLGDMAEILAARISKESRILVVGCGNSKFSQQLYDEGYTNIVNIDFSSIVIHRMAERYPHMTWIEMNMLDLQFDPSSFDVVLDKCAMDALLVTQESPWDPEPELKQEIGLYLDGVSRILVPDGQFLQISFGQPHFRRMFLDDQKRYGWTFQSQVFGSGLGYHFFTMAKIV